MPRVCKSFANRNKGKIPVCPFQLADGDFFQVYKKFFSLVVTIGKMCIIMELIPSVKKEDFS